jgi:hypothetical protein
VGGGGDWDWGGPLADLLLDILALHWCGGTVASQNRTYHIADTGYSGVARDEQLACPVGVALTAQAIERAPWCLAERL